MCTFGDGRRSERPSAACLELGNLNWRSPPTAGRGRRPRRFCRPNGTKCVLGGKRGQTRIAITLSNFPSTTAHQRDDSTTMAPPSTEE